MSKKPILIILVVLGIVILGGATSYFLFKSKTGSQVKNTGQPDTSEKSTETTLVYKDNAGFSFEYPKSIKVKDITPNDDFSYSVLSLTKTGGEIKITVIDTTAKTADEWIKSTSGVKGASLVGATTLAGLSAKQYSIDSKLLTVAADNGILYLVEGPKDAGYWEDAQNKIASTFSLTGSLSTNSGASSSSDAPSSGDVVEEEEVVQ